MTAKLLLAVAFGGAVGSVGRFVVTSLVGRWVTHGFPWGTLAVNLIGSFAMGVLVELAAQRWNVGLELRALLFTGLLGGFTTFSAYSLDLVTLIERQAWATAVAYGTGSVAFGVLGLFGGLFAVRWLLA